MMKSFTIEFQLPTFLADSITVEPSHQVLRIDTDAKQKAMETLLLLLMQQSNDDALLKIQQDLN